MSDYLKPDEVLIKINDQHENLVIRQYVIVQIAYKLPKEALDDAAELNPYVTTVTDAARKAALDAHARYRPEDHAKWSKR